MYRYMAMKDDTPMVEFLSSDKLENISENTFFILLDYEFYYTDKLNSIVYGILNATKIDRITDIPIVDIQDTLHIGNIKYQYKYDNRGMMYFKINNHITLCELANITAYMTSLIPKDNYHIIKIEDKYIDIKDIFRRNS